MAAEDVDGIRLKVDRAGQHLAGLNALVQGYVKDRSIVGHFDAQAGDYIFRVSGDPPSLLWGVVLSEALHHLRSALDQTLWQLTVARGNTPDGRIQFPIVDEEKNWAGESGRNLKGVSDDDRTFIDGKQPFHIRTLDGSPVPERVWRFAARTHPLSIIGRYDNADKHRLILAAAGMEPDWTQVEIVRDVRAFEGIHLRSGEDYNDRTEVIRVYGVESSGSHPEFRLVGPSEDDLRALGRDPKMAVKLQPAVEVAFGNPRDETGKIGWVSIDQIMFTVPAVAAIVDRFEPIIRGAAP